MLKETGDDTKPLPSVTVCGRCIYASAVLVGGSMKQPVPFFPLFAVMEAVGEHKPSEGVTLKREEFEIRRRHGRRHAHAQRNTACGRLIRLPLAQDGVPQTGSGWGRDDHRWEQALTNLLGVHNAVQHFYQKFWKGGKDLYDVAAGVRLVAGYWDTSGWEESPPIAPDSPASADSGDPGPAAISATAPPADLFAAGTPAAVPGRLSFGAHRQNELQRAVETVGVPAARTPDERRWILSLVKAALKDDIEGWRQLLGDNASVVATGVLDWPTLGGSHEAIMRDAQVANQELLDVVAGVIAMRVGQDLYKSTIRRMSTLLQVEMAGLDIFGPYDTVIKALKCHCPVMPPEHVHVPENWVKDSPMCGSVGWWCDPVAAMEWYLSFGSFRQSCEGEALGLVVCVDGSNITKHDGFTAVVAHVYNARGLWQSPTHEFIIAAWTGDESVESLNIHCGELFAILKRIHGQVTRLGVKFFVLNMGDGKQVRIETGQCSASSGSSCPNCPNLAADMGNFAELMPVSMPLRHNWKVMTNTRPRTKGVTAATQFKIDGGVQHLNVSGVDIQHYWPHCLHVGLRSVSKTWKQTYKVVLGEGEAPLRSLHKRCPISLSSYPSPLQQNVFLLLHIVYFLSKMVKTCI